jgi:transcriptional regulator NrdR family protein
MVTKVIKKNKSVQPYRESKIAKACIGAKVPAPIAAAIAKMITAELKPKKTVKSSEIKKMVLDIINKTGRASKNWADFKKKK